MFLHGIKKNLWISLFLHFTNSKGGHPATWMWQENPTWKHYLMTQAAPVRPVLGSPTRLFEGCINCDVVFDSDLRACRERRGWHTRPAFVRVRSENLHLRGKQYREACQLWGRCRHWYNDALHGIQKYLFLGICIHKSTVSNVLWACWWRAALTDFQINYRKRGTHWYWEPSDNLLLHSNLTATRCFCNCALNGHQQSWLC